MNFAEQYPDGKLKTTMLESKSNKGVYIWKLDDGHLWRDSDNNMAIVPAYKNDIAAMLELKKFACQQGLPPGKPWFFAGGAPASDETYSEQVDRLANGLLPNMNDIGAVMDAKEGLDRYGD